MKVKDKDYMYEQIQKHGENLNKIFESGIEPIKLCKKLRRLESEAYKFSLAYCNGEEVNGIKINSENWKEQITPTMNKVYKLLKNGKYNEDRPHQRGVPIFLNGDARGYALKINSDYMKLLEKQGKLLFKDLGGFGILAPDFSPNN